MGTIGQNIKRLREENGWSQVVIAKKLEVSQSSFSQWENDEYRPKFEQLRKLSNVFNVKISEIDESIALNGDAILSSPSDFRAVPLLTTAQAKELDISRPFGGIDIEDGDMVFFAKPKEGDFAVIVNGHSMEPWYPAGTRVLVGYKEIPKHGDRVVVNVPYQKELLFKVYLDLGSKFALFSINALEGIEPIVIDKMDRDAYYWVYPIKESVRNESDVDTAMRKHNIHHCYEDWVRNYKQNQGHE